MEASLTYNKRKWYFRYWYVPFIAMALFCIFTVQIYAYLTGFNTESVGATLYSVFSVGQTTYTQYFVGGYSTNESTNSLAQNIMPVIAVVMIIFYALRSLAQSEGFEGFLKTALLIVVGSALLLAVVTILANLT